MGISMENVAKLPQRFIEEFSWEILLNCPRAYRGITMGNFSMQLKGCIGEFPREILEIWKLEIFLYSLRGV